jgi:hypothetical protein
MLSADWRFVISSLGLYAVAADTQPRKFLLDTIVIPVVFTPQVLYRLLRGGGRLQQAVDTTLGLVHWITAGYDPAGEAYRISGPG